MAKSTKKPKKTIKQKRVEKYFKDTCKLIKDNKLFFVEDVVAMLPISKPTFYDYYPVDSDDFNDIKKLLDKNRIEIKVSLRNKWFRSESPALQMGLMKLISTDQELRKLSMHYNESTTRDNPEAGVIEVPGISGIDDWEKAGAESMKRIKQGPGNE